MSDSPAAILYDENGNRVGVDFNPLIARPPAYGMTAFGEYRTAQIYTLADHTNKYNLDATRWGTSTATGGTVVHVPTHSGLRLSVTGTSGSQARLRSHTFYRYQAGKGLLVKQSIIHADAGQTNQVRRWGFFCDEDGLFWELSGTTLRVVRRSSTSGSPVDTAVPRASWNVDPMDGTGPSGLTLDITKGNIYEIQLAWLGVGAVKFFVNGALAHVMVNFNQFTAPYMTTADLPLGFEVVNTGASTASNMLFVCATVLAEGGQPPPRHVHAAYTASDVVVDTTERPLLTIRPKTTFNSITNRMLVLPTKLIVSTEGARAGWRVVWNGSLTGDSFSSTDANSGVEFDVSATALTGGETLLRGFLPGTNDAMEIDLSSLFQADASGRKLRQHAFANGVDSLTILGVNEQAGNTNMRASLTWGEVR